MKCCDIGGKTGIINDLKDVWYNGYVLGIVGVVWVGFDDYSCNLGKIVLNRNIEDDVFGVELGGKIVLLVWVEFMFFVL